ncbi:hypothetical protein A2U01_0036832 [Trifolium medium]|uniref:Uncharacterized protein n=1 Tax=Trifolium medium TaxID=97028 RepID=A0A392PV42_9FABA|nr:hypothetical protein [Trifolium medium]
MVSSASANENATAIMISIEDEDFLHRSTRKDKPESEKRRSTTQSHIRQSCSMYLKNTCMIISTHIVVETTRKLMNSKEVQEYVDNGLVIPFDDKE